MYGEEGGYGEDGGCACVMAIDRLDSVLGIRTCS